MGFFDEVGSKLTQTGQKAKKTANDLVGVAKLNGQVNDQLKAIQDLYGKVGEQYFQLHGEEPEEGLAELCTQIKAAKEQLEALQLELQVLKNVKICPSCGRENPGDAKFCAHCSAPLPELPKREPQEVFCPSCGAKLAAGTAFCIKCGTKL